MNSRVPHFLAYGAGILALITAIGQMSTSIPALQGHFRGVEPAGYWLNRFTASLYLGSAGLYFTALVTLAEAYLFASTESGKQSAGKLILTISLLVHIPSILAVLLLTPSDWSHAVLHLVIMALTGTALLLRTSTLSQPA